MAEKKKIKIVYEGNAEIIESEEPEVIAEYVEAIKKRSVIWLEFSSGTIVNVDKILAVYPDYKEPVDGGGVSEA